MNSMAAICGDGISGEIRPTRLERLPVMKLSIPRTDSPRARSSAAMERPMKPAAPVTRYFGKRASSDKSPTNIDAAALVDCKRLQWLGYADAEWHGVRSNRRVKCSALRTECRVD